jgi:hypothetical protein
MDSENFEVNDTKFKITGTRLDGNLAFVSIKNVVNGKTSEIEHQKLCKIILNEQNKRK